MIQKETSYPLRKRDDKKGEDSSREFDQKKRNTNYSQKGNANFQQTYRHNFNVNMSQVEPWLDEPGTIPYALLNTDPEKSSIKNQTLTPGKNKLKKYTSIEIPLLPIKTTAHLYSKRQSKELPKMDIGSPDKHRSIKSEKNSHFNSKI